MTRLHSLENVILMAFFLNIKFQFALFYKSEHKTLFDKTRFGNNMIQEI